MHDKGDLSHPSNQVKWRCFSKAAGMTVEATPLIVKGKACGFTVNLEIAPREGKDVIWNKKIMAQLSETELPVFASVCLGYLPFCKFGRPGKGIEVKRQQGKLYFQATQGKGNIFSLPVPIGDTFNITCLVLTQLKKQTGIVDAELLLAALRGSAALYKAGG